MPQSGDILLGKYRVEALLGRGAFAEVYRVTHLSLRVPRALKILRRDAPGVGSTEFGDYRARFELEAQLGARLNSPTPHPHLIQVYDFHVEGGVLALEMEYAPGGSLADRLDRVRDAGHGLEVDEAVRVARDVAEGLAALHAVDAVHRDLKPSNILFDAGGRAKVGDLGLAQVPGGPSQRSLGGSQAPEHPGTPGYKSPEQEWTRAYLKPASDVYSLGVVLFEMLTGRMATSLRPGTRARAYRPDVPEWLDELMVRMLADEPGNRPWDGAEANQLLAEGWQRLEAERRQAAEEAQRRLEEEARARRVREQKAAAAAARAEAEAARLAEQARRRQEVAAARWAWLRRRWQFLLGGALGIASLAVVIWLITRPPEPPRVMQETRALTVAQALPPSLAAQGATLTPTATPPSPTHTPTSTPQPPTWTPSHMPTATSRPPTHTPTSTPQPPTWTPPAIPLPPTRMPAVAPAVPGAGSTWTSPVDGMVQVYVPAGEFLMGSADSDSDAFPDEKPQHTVTLDAFWTDRTEVTSAQYAQCVAAGQCAAPDCDAGGADHPVVCVAWQDAANYCAWAGRRLPTEAEWEKAARGTDGRTYPWGSVAPDCKRLNYWGKDGGCVGGVTAVGSYPAGASPYGALDMAGNVFEWVADWYGEQYYASSPAENPVGPASGQHHVLRGGSWNVDQRDVRAASRYWFNPEGRLGFIGFRCARSE